MLRSDFGSALVSGAQKSGTLELVAHLVPNPFGPRTSGPPLPVPMDKWSPKIRSPWTNGPHQIWSPWTNGPQNFGQPGQMVPNQFGPRISNHHSLSPWTNRVF